ncbi:MAG: hypothetical protein Q8Q73_01520 [Stagnimonas sp.]|nr:hypothetical protein [Stagnimonas sp.]
MSRILPLIALAALALAPASQAQQLPLPSSLPLTPSIALPLPPITLPSIPALPVIPIGPRIQGQIPIQYKGSGLIIFYDTQSPYPVEYTFTGIVSPPP